LSCTSTLSRQLAYQVQPGIHGVVVADPLGLVTLNTKPRRYGVQICVGEFALYIGIGHCHVVFSRLLFDSSVQPLILHRSASFASCRLPNNAFGIEDAEFAGTSQTVCPPQQPSLLAARVA